MYSRLYHHPDPTFTCIHPLILLSSRFFIKPTNLSLQLDQALIQIRTLHTSKLLAYKRLLERAHASSAAQVYHLQAQLAELRSQSQAQAQGSLQLEGGEYCVCGGRKRGYWDGVSWGDVEEDETAEGGDLVNAMKKLDERAIRRAMRGLGREKRGRV